MQIHLPVHNLETNGKYETMNQIIEISWTENKREFTQMISQDSIPKLVLTINWSIEAWFRSRSGVTGSPPTQVQAMNLSND